MHLTIAIPTRNRAQTLAACLAHLDGLAGSLAAAGHSLSVVVSDNCSEDETQAVLAAPRAFPLFRFRRDVAGPIYESIATAMLRASVGPPDDGVILLGDDDSLDPAAVCCALDHLAAAPALIGVAAGMQIVRNVDSPLTCQLPPDGQDLIISRHNIAQMLIRTPYLEAAILRRKCWRDIHPYPGIGLPCQTEALVRYCLNGSLLWKNDLILNKFVHQNSESMRIYNSYHQLCMIEDYERSISELIRNRIIDAYQTPFGIIVVHNYFGAFQVGFDESPLPALSMFKRMLIHRIINENLIPIECNNILQAAAQHALMLARLLRERAAVLRLAEPLDVAMQVIQRFMCALPLFSEQEMRIGQAAERADLILVRHIEDIPAQAARDSQTPIIALDALLRWSRVSGKPLRVSAPEGLITLPM